MRYPFASAAIHSKTSILVFFQGCILRVRFCPSAGRVPVGAICHGRPQLHKGGLGEGKLVDGPTYGRQFHGGAGHCGRPHAGEHVEDQPSRSNNKLRKIVWWRAPPFLRVPLAPFERSECELLAVPLFKVFMVSTLLCFRPTLLLFRRSFRVQRRGRPSPTPAFTSRTWLQMFNGFFSGSLRG